MAHAVDGFLKGFVIIEGHGCRKVFVRLQVGITVFLPPLRLRCILDKARENGTLDFFSVGKISVNLFGATQQGGTREGGEIHIYEVIRFGGYEVIGRP